jgi:rhamnose transport system ATP-binding protein
MGTNGSESESELAVRGTVASASGSVLATENISRSFGGVHALTDVSATFAAGQIYGLVGENGAGKSTFGKVLAGLHRPDSGRILVDGEEANYKSPHQALRDGITMMAQELSLEPRRTVLENMMLGSERVRHGLLDKSTMRGLYQNLSRQTGFDLPAGAVLGDLRLADQQKVEIMRCLARGARVIIMDEPTAALTSDETRGFWQILERLKAAGTTVILISHGLEDVLRVCDEVYVLRNGRNVVNGPAGAFTTDTLITAMVGRALDTTFPSKSRVATGLATALSVRGLCTREVTDISFEVGRGEIIGLAGLVGSGRSEVLRGIFGADVSLSGEIAVGGQVRTIRSPRDAIRAGIALIPESRKDQGLVMGRSTRENIALPHLHKFSGPTGLLRRRPESQQSAATMDEVGVRPDALDAPVETLSGGNQQKVLFAKWLLHRPVVLLADEPTRGVDIPAKMAIYRLLVKLAEQGMAIIVVSSEMEEIRMLAHRLLVLRNGCIQGELSGEADEHEILRLAFGVDQSVTGAVPHSAAAC